MVPGFCMSRNIQHFGSTKKSTETCRPGFPALHVFLDEHIVPFHCTMIFLVQQEEFPFSSDPCEFFRVGNDPNRLNLPFLHINGQDGECLTACADDQGCLTVDFL